MGISSEGPAEGAGPRGGGGVGGEEDLKIPHAVHLPEAGGGGFNGASPVPPASESRLWRIDFGNWSLLARKLCFGQSFLDEKVIRNRSWEGLWEVWGGSWEVFGRLLVPGWCLGGSGGILGSIFGGPWPDLAIKMK